EKAKYLRSRPSEAWQSAQRARIDGALGRLFAASRTLRQSSCPVRSDSGSRKGGVHELGSSCLKASGSRTLVESAVRKLKATTRKPLATPSVLLKRNRIVLAP